MERGRRRDGYLQKQWPDKTIQSQLVELMMKQALLPRCSLCGFTLGINICLCMLTLFFSGYLPPCVQPLLSLLPVYVFVFLTKKLSMCECVWK